MSYANFIRGIVKRNPNLKLNLKKADSKLTPFRYVYQSLFLTIMLVVFLVVFSFILFKSKPDLLLILVIGEIVLAPIIFKIMMGIVDVQVVKLGRELDGDLLFASEYLLVALESGLPIGNAIENLSKVNRPSGRFFKRVYTEFETGKSLDGALSSGASFSASKELRKLIKKLQDSINIGSDISGVLEVFIEDASEKKLIEAKAYSKKLNPIVMMYLLLGIVVPSLGITFIMIGFAMMSGSIGTSLLKWILVLFFLMMFIFQYFAYSIFKFKKDSM